MRQPFYLSGVKNPPTISLVIIRSEQFASTGGLSLNPPNCAVLAIISGSYMYKGFEGEPFSMYYVDQT